MDTEKLRSFCLSLAGATEGIKWEDHLCFMVGGKIFCITGMDDSAGVSLKVPEEDFDLLTERDGLVQAGYMARRKWIQVQSRNKLRPEEWEHFLQQSYELVKAGLPKKLQKEIDG